MSIFSSNKDQRETPPASGFTPATSNAAAASTPASQPSGYQSSPSHSSTPQTTISEGTTLEGQIKIEGDIKIEGNVKGTVTSKGKVIISGTGKVDGDIICHSAEIAGIVGGKLKVADILFLKGNATINGDINTGKLVIENGVKFNGNCTMGIPVSASAPTPKPATANTVDLNAK
jgi:hypothetical protein